ncbi:TlpA disulfide reductase family protein [Sphingomonas sp. RB3P16]|uniref:TlpA family protein disulfide reductase n=1 Tax=Parasphingomonas frigoris TaxID=3096163 RepID=UPI002FC6797E
MAKSYAMLSRLYRSRAAALLLAFGVASTASASAAPAPAPDFTVQLLVGGAVTSDTLKGKVIILNFWASWCVPCKRELAELDASFVRHGSNRLAIFAINAEQSPNQRGLAQQAARMTIPVATSVTGGYRPRNNAVPTSFVIDADGKLVLTKAGAWKPGEVDVLIQTLLAPSSASYTTH